MEKVILQKKKKKKGISLRSCKYLQYFFQDSSRLIVVKLKWDPKDSGYVYFEPVRQNVIYQVLSYLKHTINSIRIIPFQKVTLAKK